MSNEYGKNSKTNKFNKILVLVCEKAKKAFTKSANTKKIAKVTKIFIATVKQKWSPNFAKVTEFHCNNNNLLCSN